jgi:hypothetical protein
MAASPCSPGTRSQAKLAVSIGFLAVCFLAGRNLPQLQAEPPVPSDAEVAQSAVAELPATAQEPDVGQQTAAPELVYDDYFEAYQAAGAAGKDLIVYCFDPENPRPAQIEFESETLAAADVRDRMSERFLLVKVPTDSPVLIHSTVRKTSYVRQGFRRVQKTWNQQVERDLFNGRTSRTGILVVDVTEAEATAAPTILIHLPFQAEQLSPYVYAVDRKFQPWKRKVVCDLVSVPTESAQSYVQQFCSRQSLDNASIQRDFPDQIKSLHRVYFDYAFTREQLRPDRVTTRVHLAGNSELAGYQEPLAVRIDAYSLNDSAVPVQYAYARVRPTDEWQELTVSGLNPETAYRFHVYFYTPGASRGLLGEAELPFHAVTAGVEKVAQARAEIAMKALGEVNDWRRGSYDRRKGYVVGRWCERFYCWNILEHVNTPFSTSYSPSIFSRHGALFSGGVIRRLMHNSDVMGAHVRTSDHGFMVLAYDRHLGQVWTIEGNYGNRVVLTRRYPSDYWSLGTIVESMLKEPSQDG